MAGPVYCSVSATALPVQSGTFGGSFATQAVTWTRRRQDADSHSTRLEHWLRTRMGSPLTSSPQAPAAVSTRALTVVVVRRPSEGTVAQLIGTAQTKLLMVFAAMEKGEGSTQPRAESIGSVTVTLVSGALPALIVRV